METPPVGPDLIWSPTISPFALGLSVFIGVGVVIMHHLAIMSRESSAWKKALYLLRTYDCSVYVVAVAALAGRLLDV